MKPRILLSLFFWIGASASQAASWYVDAAAPVGGDGSPAQPWSSIAEGVLAAASGDTVHLAAGRYVEASPILLGTTQRMAVLPLHDGITVIGAGVDQTILVSPHAAPRTHGIAGAGLGAATRVSDMSVEGPCLHGIHLRGSTARLERIHVRSELVGSSSTGFDAREECFPTLIDCTIDGGHNAAYIEFGSGGSYHGCTFATRPRETLVIIDSNPMFTNCVIESGGRDTIGLSQGSQPAMSGCEIQEGARWTLRVIDYASGSTIELGGNRWFSGDPQLIAASILDAVDDPALGATVQYLPLLGPVASVPLNIGGLKLRFHDRGGAR